MNNKRPKSPLFKKYKWVSLALLVICLLFIYFIPRAIMYLDHMIIAWTSFLFIFFIIPVLVLVTLWTFTNRGYLSVGLAAASVLIVGPTFGLFQAHREKMELKKYGVWTNGVVINRKQISEHGAGFQHWAIKCRYIVNRHSYETLYHDDLENLHPVGDTIKIIYSSMFPKIYALGNEWTE
jgi:hypothetical protein